MKEEMKKPMVQIASMVGLVGLVLSAFLLTKIISEVKTFDDPEQGYYNSISVNAEGEVVAIPDIGTFNFSVSETAESVDVAQNNSAEKINPAINYLKENGVSENDIKTTSYNANPKYEWQQGFCNEFRCEPGEQILIGYEVSQAISVKVRETDKAGELLSGIGKFGISNISGLSFTTDDEESLKSEARSKAIANAKTQAEKIANDLGVKLGKVIGFYEESGDYPMYECYGGGDFMEAKTMAIPEIPKGENIIKSRVSVTYVIE